MRKIVSICIMLAMVFSFTLTVNAATKSTSLTVPETKARQTGVAVTSNASGTIDLSNAAEGYALVKYTGGKNIKIKVQVIKTNGDTYNYDLNNKGSYETFSFTQGDGEYTVRILENVQATKYAVVHSTVVNIKLRNAILPFMYANQYVNYTSKSVAVTTAEDLTKDCKTSVDKLSAIYEYVIKNISYDYDFAAKVINGEVKSYVPDIDSVLDAKKGICFDYASLMTAMLRSQGIPCKLVIGYAGTQYHAWINVFIDGVGWVDQAIFFDGTSWTLMDPTFVSGSTDSNRDAIMKYIGDGSNYSQKSVY